MIVRVCERVAASRRIDRTIVATDDERIHAAVTAAGFECVMTRADHETGSDRLAEVAETLSCDLVVNVQGDEPMLSPSIVDAAVDALVEDAVAVASTTSEPLVSVAQFLDPNVVKVVIRSDGRALYFSRASIPYPRDAGALADLDHLPEDLAASCRKHTGLYVYRRPFLLEFSRLPRTPLERLERLEQLRILEHGYEIRVVEVAERSIGVDTQADLDRVRELWPGDVDDAAAQPPPVLNS